MSMEMDAVIESCIRTIQSDPQLKLTYRQSYFLFLSSTSFREQVLSHASN